MPSSGYWENWVQYHVWTKLFPPIQCFITSSNKNPLNNLKIQIKSIIYIKLSWYIFLRCFTGSCFLCLQLLRRSPERRLGAGERDAEEVKKHLFFRVRGEEKPRRSLLKWCATRILTAACVCVHRTWTGTACWPRRWSRRSCRPSRAPTTSATSTMNLPQRLRF